MVSLFGSWPYLNFFRDGIGPFRLTRSQYEGFIGKNKNNLNSLSEVFRRFDIIRPQPDFILHIISKRPASNLQHFGNMAMGFKLLI